MSEYKVVLSLPGIPDSPKFAVYVSADDEDSAIDKGFERAFAEYAQYGGFQVDAVDLV